MESTKKDAETRMKIAKYNREYYQGNRKRIARQRRERYAYDPSYRSMTKTHANKYYKKNRKPKNPGIALTVKKTKDKQLFSIKYLADVIGYSQSYIRLLEKDGVVPVTTYTDSRKWRLYSKKQIELCITAFGERNAYRWDMNDIKEYLNKHWNEEER